MSRRKFSRRLNFSAVRKELCLLLNQATQSRSALKCKETGEEKTILFGLTGTGYFDMKAYEAFNNGTMSDYIPTDEEIKKSIDLIPRFPGNEF